MFINNNFRFCSLCTWKDYPKTFLEECKYMRENAKTKNYINMELELKSDSDSDIYIDE